MRHRISGDLTDAEIDTFLRVLSRLLNRLGNVDVV